MTGSQPGAIAQTGVGVKNGRVPLPAAVLFGALRRRVFSHVTGNLLLPLGERTFALMWSGQAVSRLGDEVYRVVLPWWVLEETGSAAAVATVVACQLIPMLIFLLAGGVLVDRVSRLRVMFWSDVARGVVSLLVAIAAFAGTLDAGHVYAASALFGFAAAFFQPAYSAVVPEVVPQERLASANALTALSQQAAAIAGPALGGVCIALWGTTPGFLLNAVSFVIAAACVLALPWRSIGRPEGVSGAGVMHELGAGFRVIFASAWLWMTVALAALLNVALAGAMRVALPYLLKEERGEGASAFALFLTAAAAGSVAAALVAGGKGRIRRRGLIAYGALAGNGLMLLAISFDVPFAALLAAGAFGGACLVLFELCWVSTIQEIVPTHLMGRVFSVDHLGSLALLPVGVVAAGWATNRIGAAELMLGGGVAVLVLAATGALHPAVRRMD